MDIKDSYLHGTVGVVKSISVSADKLKYTLADIAGTVKEITLPVATASANGLMSSGDKTKLDNLSSTIGNYVTLNTDQEITGIKTFTKQQKFTVAKGTAPFQVTSTTKVPNLNADLLDGFGESAFLKDRGVIKADTIETTLTNGVYYTSEFCPPDAGYNYGSVLNFRSYPTLTQFYISDGAQTKPRIWYRNKWNAQTIINTSWLEILTSNSYTNYTVGKDGTGATGNWGINITGDANTSRRFKLLLTESSPTSKDLNTALSGGGMAANYGYLMSHASGFINAPSGSSYGCVIQFSKNNNELNGQLAWDVNHHGADSTRYLWWRANDDTDFANAKWHQIAFTDSDITGNAATATHASTADKLKTKRKLWGQDFDGSADVSGSLTGVTSINMNGNIVINDGVNHDRYIKWQYDNTDNFGWRIGYLGSKGGDDNDLTFDSHRKHEGWASALYFKHTTLNAHFAGIVIAPTFQGNLDGTYVNKLTGYTKATAIGSIAATDTLNTALGKLEYKADVAYNLVKGAYDGDGTIENLTEILKVLEGIKDTETIKAIIGKYLPLTGGTLSNTLYIKSNSAVPLRIYRNTNPIINFNQIESDGTTTNFGYLGFTEQNKAVIMYGSNSGSTVYDLIHSGNYTSYLPILNSASTHATNASVIYAPSTAGTKNQVLLSNGSGAPVWANQSSLSVGSATNWGNSVSWTASTTVGSWSRILTITNYANVLLSTNWSQSSQASQHLYLISIGYGTAKVVQLGCNNYSGNYAVKIRIIKEAAEKHHVEVYNTHGYNGATTIPIGCRATNIGTQASLTTITTNTAGSGIAVSSLTSHYNIARNLHSEWSSNGMFYIEGTGTTAGTWLGSHSEIKSYYTGLTIAYKIPIAGASTTTLNINSLGAKTCYINTSKLTTHYGVGAIAILVYDGTYFRAADYWDGNSYAYVRQYTTDSTNAEYPLLFRYNTEAPTANGYVTEYTRYDSGITINPSTNTITATTFKGTATQVSCTASSSDVTRPIVLTDTYSKLHYTTKATINYSTGNITAPTFTGNLKGTADKSKVLSNYYSSRQTTIKPGITGDGSMIQYKSTSTCTDTDKPGEGHILHFNWDNNGGWDSQLCIHTTTPNLSTRCMNSGTWSEWARVITSLNYTSYLGYIGTTAVQSSAVTQSLTGIGDIHMAGDIIITTGDTDKCIYFDYDGNKTAGSSWRTGMLGSGSGDTNYFVIQSGTSDPSITTWTNTIRISQNTYNIAISGNLYPLLNNSKTLGTSSLKWANVYATTFTGNLSGNATTASSAAKWTTARTLTVGYKGQSVNGTANVTWNLHDILLASTQIGTSTSWQIYNPGVYYVAASSAFTGDGNPESANGGLTPYRYGQLIVSRAGDGGVAQFYISHCDSKNTESYGIKFRTGWNNTYLGKWESILDTSNYTYYTVTKTGTGATGTWDINITGSAGSVAWGNITGKPTIPTVTDYYWANIKISSTSNNYTNPIFASLFLNSGDATLKMYQGKVRDGYSDGNFCLQTCIDGQDGETNSYASYQNRNVLCLQPRGGKVYIGSIPDGGTHTLNVNGNAYIGNDLTMGDTISVAPIKGTWVSGKTSAAIEYNSLTAINSTSLWKFYNMKSASGNVVCFGGLGNSIGFYGYYANRTDNGTDWEFLVNTNNGNWSLNKSFTAVNLIKSGSSDNYVLLGGGGHKTLSSITAASLNSTTVISAKEFSLSNASWTDTGYTFASLASGTYAVQITSGTNLVASGIMSVYKNLSDTAGDEIPLHVYGTAGWRPYLRTYNNKLQISSNDTSSTKRTVTIKIAQIL